MLTTWGRYDSLAFRPLQPLNSKAYNLGSAPTSLQSLDGLKDAFSRLWPRGCTFVLRLGVPQRKLEIEIARLHAYP